MIRDRLEWIPLTLYAIFRNKRRSFAMISGIILGVTILSGIFIYSSVLDQQNFESVVNSAAYEVRFDIFDNETISSLETLRPLVDADERVLDTTIVAREPDASEANADFIPSLVFNNEADVIDLTRGPPAALTVPLFVSSDYFEDEIGRTFDNKIEGSKELQWNETMISRTLASKKQFKVGDVLSAVNVSYTRLERVTQIAKVFEGYAENITVAGIYEDDGASAGIFSNIFDQDEIYFSIDILQNLTEIKSMIDNENGYFLATKIDESKFSVSDPADMSEEIDQFITAISKIAETIGLSVGGNNEIAILLLPFEFQSFFITLFDVLLAGPVVILSLYLLFFGLEMSLEERRREIAIKKVQGADSRQVFSELRNEAILLFFIGAIIGYVGGIIGAWLISSAVGFMNLNVGGIDSFVTFFKFDTSAIAWSVVIVGGILIAQTIRQGRAFIESEVSEGVQKEEQNKGNFIKRNKVDIILFIIGLMSIAVSLLENEFDVDLNLSFFPTLIIIGFGPFFLWIGGALVGARITKYIPLKIEPIFLNLPFLRDVARVIRSGLRRRGDTDRLAVIIVLTLSIATLAAAQGNTEQIHGIRNLEYEVGADVQVNFSFEAANYTTAISNIDGVADSLAIGVSSRVRIFARTFEVVGFDVSKEYQNLQNNNPVAIWHEDSFRDDVTPSQALKRMVDNPNGIFISRGTQNLFDVVVGDTIKIRVLDQVNDTATPIIVEDIEILGIYDHGPAEIIGSDIMGSAQLVNRINSIANHLDTIPDVSSMQSEKILIRTTYGDDITAAQINAMKIAFAQLPDFGSSTFLQQELNDAANQIGSFGVSGLLSLNFLVSLSAAFISTFAFSAILMERRRREFAVLRAIGARKSQIYKLALGENLMMVTTAVVWGSIIGYAITYQFNGVFELFATFLGGGPLNRIVAFPLLQVTIIGIFTTIGMLLATLFSVRSAANQDLSTATRVI